MRRSARSRPIAAEVDVRILLDTHSVLWFLAGDRALSRRARRVIEKAGNEKYVSVASVWEMAIKVSLGKLRLGQTILATVEALRSSGIEVLSVEADHAGGVAELPWHHDDPFDRLLASQARIEGLTIVSRDDAFDGYGVRRIW